MIRISLGNVGSGKTANEVREMYLNPAKIKTYTNIKTKLNHQIDISPDMVATLGEDGKLRVNMDFWMEIQEPINIVIDEAHSIINSRRAMSKVNVVVTDWLSLVRRFLGEDSRGAGELVFITQLPNRIDNIAREMATQVRYHVCHYWKTCLNCGYSWYENSDMPEKMGYCENCLSTNIRKHHHQIEIKHYPNMESYNFMKVWGKETHYRHYFVRDIEKYFPLYDTLQWDNMLSELYIKV
jgi:hypothetical protein